MHRALRVGEYWNWLPTFRAVAETANLRDAAKRLHVAPSAISRTVRLLEGSLGHALFERTAGNLVLNAAGRQLLEGVRGAMRLINDAHGETEPDGPCHIHCPTDVVPLLLDALEAWSAARPSSPPLVHVPCAEDIAEQLLRGDLDVALAFEPATQAGIESTLLGELSSSVYAAASHPAARLKTIGEAELATLAFVDFPVGDLRFLRVMRDRERQCVAYVPTMELAVRICARGMGLVAVSDFVAASVSASLAAPLVRLPYELPDASLHLWFRRPLRGMPAPAIVEHLAAAPVFSTLIRHRGTDEATASPTRPSKRKTTS